MEQNREVQRNLDLMVKRDNESLMSRRLTRCMSSIVIAADLCSEEYNTRERIDNRRLLNKYSKLNKSMISSRSLPEKTKNPILTESDRGSKANSLDDSNLMAITSSTFQKFSSELKRCVGPYMKKTNSEDEAEEGSSAFLAKNVSDTAEKISEDKEELKKLLEHLRSTGIVTNSGIRAVLPNIIEPKTTDDALKLRRKVDVKKKNLALLREGALNLEKDTCGLKWNTTSYITKTSSSLF